ncbi:MAG: hypothetical protein ACO3S5_13195 [Ilumatobacteraceae bacterium]
MPRSLQDILDHADEIAKAFDEFDPDTATEIPVEEYLIQRAVIAQAECERQLLESIARARVAGLTWVRIGTLLGVSPQAAQQRYGPRRDRH